MKDEKKPPQEVVAILNTTTLAAPTWPPPGRHADETADKKVDRSVVATGSGARIMLDLDRQGDVIMSATCFGVPDCSYAAMSDHRLLNFGLPALLTELREQIRLGRRLTVDESAEFLTPVQRKC